VRRAIAIIALVCVAFVGAMAAVILLGDGAPEAGGTAVTASADDEIAVANRQSKADRLAVAMPASAPEEPAPTAAPPAESLRQAFAATPSPEIEGLKLASPPLPAAAPKAKAASKPPVQKPYALLSDAQIASIKERLRLTSNQESYWPAVENALRAVARKIHATRQADPNGTAFAIDPDAEEVQQLKSAAMPLLLQLREDQKREVRTLARLIGLEKVAAAI
jgi:hypothetical protein